LAFDVAIVGGGIIGCSLAWHLAGRGASVVLLERGEIGTEASWAAGGQFVANANEATSPAMLAFCLASQRLYPAFLDRLREETGAAIECRITGRLQTATTDAEHKWLRNLFTRQAPAGVVAEWWDADRVRQAEPSLHGVIAAIHFPEHGYVDNRVMVPAIAEAAARRGALVRTHAPVRSVRRRGDRVDGVELLSGESIAANAVVNASGAWAGLLGEAGGLPIEPSKGEMVAVEMRPPPIARIISFVGITLVPRANGRVFLAATKESVGFDRRSTLGNVHRLMNAAVTRLPALAGARFVEAWAGLRPRATDELPVVGPGDAAGLFHATGHFSMGILCAPATALALGELILTGASPLPIDAFAPSRFTSGGSAAPAPDRSATASHGVASRSSGNSSKPGSTDSAGGAGSS
jgi:glycine oxidase